MRVVWPVAPGTGPNIGAGADGSVYKIRADEISSTGGYSISVCNVSCCSVVPYAAAINISVIPYGRP